MKWTSCRKIRTNRESMKTTFTLSIVWFLALAGLLAAQSGDNSAQPKGKPQPMNVTPEREAAVRTFVERNHPELSELLAHLKANQTKEYERAVRELHRTTERLAGIQERDRTQYDLELKLWTAQSHVQLMTARLKMGASEDLKTQLRKALGTQAEAKVALLKHERSRAAERLSRIERDIAQFETDREKVIEKQLDLLVRSASSGKDAKSKAGRPGAKASANKPGGKSGKRANTTVATP